MQDNQPRREKMDTIPDSPTAIRQVMEKEHRSKSDIREIMNPVNQMANGVVASEKPSKSA